MPANQPYTETPLEEATPLLDRFRQMIGADPEPGQGVKQTVEGAPGLIFLWDVVDQKKVGPFPREQMELYLRKVTIICSACKYSSPAAGREGTANLIREHIEAARGATQRHRSAQIVNRESNRPGFSWVDQCTGCGTTFAMQKGAAWTHLEKMLQAASQHEGAVPLTILKYSLTPVELPAIARLPAPEERTAVAVAARPASAQEAGSREGRKRKRHHGRKKSGVSGDSNGKDRGH